MRNNVKEKAMVAILAAAMAMSMMACGSTDTKQESADSTVVTESTENTDNTADTAESTQEAASAEDAAAETTQQETEDAAKEDSASSAENADKITILSYLGDETSGNDSEDKMTAIFTENAQNTDIKISVSDQKLQEAENGDKLTYAAGCDTLVQFVKVEDSTKEALQKALDQENETQMELMRESYADMVSFDQEMASMNAEDGTEDAAAEDTTGSDMRYSFESTVAVKRADDKIVSYLRQNYSYTGGAHPSTVYNGYNYDPQTGNTIKLQDVVTDYDGLYQAVVDALKKVNESQDNAVLFDEYEDTVNSMFYGASADDASSSADYSTADMLNWVMTDNGLYIIFNQYDIAPYAVGQFVAEIPFTSGLLNENYK